MSSNKKRKSYYNTDSFPTNYSGQYTSDAFSARNIHSVSRIRDAELRDDIVEGRITPEYAENREGENRHEGEVRREGEHRSEGERAHGGEHPPEGGNIPAGGSIPAGGAVPPHGEPERKGSILDSLGGIFKKRDDGGGFLKNLFTGKKIKNIFTDLDFEDLILLGVMFFLLRDGAEDELLIILAIILFTGG